MKQAKLFLVSMVIAIGALSSSLHARPYQFSEYCTGEYEGLFNSIGGAYAPQEISDISQTMNAMMHYYQKATGNPFINWYRGAGKFLGTQTVCVEAQKWFEQSQWQNVGANPQKANTFLLPNERGYIIENIEPFALFGNIEHLILAGHAVKDVFHLQYMQNLKYLDLSRFGEVPVNLFELVQLEHLMLSANSIKLKEIIGVDKLVNLKTLNFDGNEVDLSSSFLFDIANNLHQLESLSLKGNDLDSILPNIVAMRSLRRLDLSENPRLDFNGLGILFHREENEILTIGLSGTLVTNPDWFYFGYKSLS